MKKSAAALVLTLAVLVGLTGCEPSMKITAHDADNSFTCGYVMHVKGNVTPANATPKVVLQQTKGGKWVDVKGWATQDSMYAHPTAPTARTANVSTKTGGYSIAYYVDWMGTKHLRVRSNGSSATSPGFYVKVIAQDGC